jgi:hypothetical protein
MQWYLSTAGTVSTSYRLYSGTVDGVLCLVTYSSVILQERLYVAYWNLVFCGPVWREHKQCFYVREMNTCGADYVCASFRMSILENGLTDFDEMWCGRYAIEGWDSAFLLTSPRAIIHVSWLKIDVSGTVSFSIIRIRCNRSSRTSTSIFNRLTWLLAREDCANVRRHGSLVHNF